MDEISTIGPTHVAELKDGDVRDYVVHPKDFGLPTRSKEELTVSSVEESAAALDRVLAGEKGARLDTSLLNAAAAIAAAGAAQDIKSGLKLAAKSVESGAAHRALDVLILVSNSAPDDTGARLAVE